MTYLKFNQLGHGFKFRLLIDNGLLTRKNVNYKQRLDK